MKLILAGTLTLAVLTLGGCALNRSELGGDVSREEHEFRVSAPFMGVSMNQGEVETVDVTIHRGDMFNQDVVLRMKTSDDLTIEPVMTTIRSSDTDTVQLVITADADAALVTHQVEVEATPATLGKSTWVRFPVRVTAR